MQIALGIGTMLLGGWVLSAPTENPQTDEMTTPRSVQSEPFAYPSSKTAKEKNAERMRAMKRDTRLSRDNDQDQDRSVEEKMRSGSSKLRARQRSMPSEPTAPADSFGGGSQGLPMSPTQASDEDTQNGDQANGGSRLPVAPTYRPAQNRPSGGFLSSPTRSILDQRLNNQLYGSPSYSAQTSEKAFANQKVFTSGVSPYMNLFRNDTNGGTIDNYSTYVKPALEQQKTNQQLGMDIYGLERNARIQNANLQRLDRRSRAPQSVGTPQFYQKGGSVNSYGDSNSYDNGQ